MAAGARLFDLDGTLWDSFAFYSAIVSRGGAITAEAASAALLDGENVVSLMRRLGLPRNTLSGSLARSSAVVVPHDGMVAVLHELRERGHPLAVVTSLPGTFAHRILQQLGLADLFPVVIHAGSRAGRKPNPQPILAALMGLAVSASQAHVYIGDTDVDLEAANRAGVRFAWASWGYGDMSTNAAVLLRACV